MKASAPTGLQKSVILREAKFQINNPYNAPSERELSYHKVWLREFAHMAQSEFNAIEQEIQ